MARSMAKSRALGLRNESSSRASTELPSCARLASECRLLADFASAVLAGSDGWPREATRYRN